MKNDAKFEEEMTCQFKIDVRNFDPSTQKWRFNGVLLTKLYNA